MWIARDRNGELYAYSVKPVKDKFDGVFTQVRKGSIELDFNEFKDVTWENSPREIKCCPSTLDQLNYHIDTTPKEQLDEEFNKISREISQVTPVGFSEIDWESVRVKAAIQIMASLVGCDSARELRSRNTEENYFSKSAVAYANELIEILKK